ncbi:MAG TPA: UDP-glucose 4-epimerase GalE [Phycisphaerales bacterium]|nr:UDP-glucose 4-epimerase GalE [Phycisphaerales bacterium]
MNILVTGGAGYVGSACVRWLVKHGHNPIAYDNMKEGHKSAVPDGRLVVGDIQSTDALAAVMGRLKTDAVMHFAAATYVGESVTNPDYHYGNNIAGTLSLLRAMQKAGVKRMLFSSTCATYGMNPKIPMSEESQQDPFSPYARTKLAVEWMIRDFAHAYGLGFTLLRYFNAAGADDDARFGEDHRPETHIIPLVLDIPMGRRKEFTLFGTDYPTHDGTCVRDYIHTADLAQAHHLAIEATTPTTAEVYNIGTGNGQSNLQIIRACEEVTGVKIPVKTAERRPGDPPALVADPAKLKTRLGWKPKYTNIVDTVRTAWNWHKANPNGYPD